MRKLVRKLVTYLEPKNFLWICQDLFYRLRRRFLKKRRDEIIRESNISVEFDRAKFIFTFGSRLIGNRDNLIEDLFKSFLKNTVNRERFEFRIKVDSDDDLIYFDKLKSKFRMVQMHFYYTPRGNGYADMHLWHHELFLKRGRNIRYHIIITDDVIFSQENWDLDLESKIKEKERKTNYWVGMPNTLDQAIELLGPNPREPIPVYWIAGTDFPILSVDFILLISEHLSSLDREDWLPYGNLFNIDSYFGDLLRQMDFEIAKNCHMQIGNYFQRTGITSWSSHVWPGESGKGQLRTITLKKFFSPDSQNVRKGISSHLEEKISNSMKREV